MLEGLIVLAGGRRRPFTPSTPSRLRAARTCYDHLAGEVGVALHDRLRDLGFLTGGDGCDEEIYDVSPAGAQFLAALGVDVARRPRPAPPLRLRLS